MSDRRLATEAGRLKGAICGLTAAALFGASAPVAKLLLPGASPLSLSALLYLGAGLGLCIPALRRRDRDREGQAEAPFRGRDWVLLGTISLTGGVIGPLLMLWGLERLSGVVASLLLNLEGPFTILIAVTLFREHLSRREAASAALVLGGAALLGFRPGQLHVDGLGVLALAGACAVWGIDNNLTQRLSLRDPLVLARAKTLSAGTLSLILALAFGSRFPVWPAVAAALLLGSVSYGISVLLDAYALSLLGASREAAFFATAPFAGAALAIPLLGERPSLGDAAAGLLLAAGVAILITARHGHEHAHEALEHEHAHVHDEHHQHQHEGPVREPHSHPHRHTALIHDHPHVSDAHHRHRHGAGTSSPESTH
jgi:drug/metabolite transporter (DMT)-like permease